MRGRCSGHVVRSPESICSGPDLGCLHFSVLRCRPPWSPSCRLPPFARRPRQARLRLPGVVVQTIFAESFLQASLQDLAGVSPAALAVGRGEASATQVASPGRLHGASALAYRWSKSGFIRPRPAQSGSHQPGPAKSRASSDNSRGSRTSISERSNLRFGGKNFQKG